MAPEQLAAVAVLATATLDGLRRVSVDVYDAWAWRAARRDEREAPD